MVFTKSANSCLTWVTKFSARTFASSTDFCVWPMMCKYNGSVDSTKKKTIINNNKSEGNIRPEKREERKEKQNEKKAVKKKKKRKRERQRKNECTNVGRSIKIARALALELDLGLGLAGNVFDKGALWTQ